MWQTVPNFAAEIKAILTESGEEDANPIRVLYDFMTNDMIWLFNFLLIVFDGDPDTADSSWKIASDYCDEISFI